MTRSSILACTAVLLLTASPAAAAAESAGDSGQFEGVILTFVFGLVVGALAFLHAETRGRKLVREEDEEAARRSTGGGG